MAHLPVKEIISLVLSLAWLAAAGQIPSHAAPGPDLKPEKNVLEVAIAAYGSLYLPLLVAHEAGYFSKRGVNLNISQVSATASAQALISGKVDIYQGGASLIHANVGGSDLIYIAAAVDRSALILFGQKGLTTFESLRGKSVATTSVGAFGEVAIRKTAKERGMEVGKDIKLLYHRGPPEAAGTFLSGNADGLIVGPPESERARSKGFPVIIDYYERGLRIVGPGTGVARFFMQKTPNTLKVFLMGYLDGLKRTLDDPAFANKIQASGRCAACCARMGPRRSRVRQQDSGPIHQDFRPQGAGGKLSKRPQGLEQRHDRRSRSHPRRARTIHSSESQRD